MFSCVHGTMLLPSLAVDSILNVRMNVCEECLCVRGDVCMCLHVAYVFLSFLVLWGVRLNIRVIVCEGMSVCTWGCTYVSTLFDDMFLLSFFSCPVGSQNRAEFQKLEDQRRLEQKEKEEKEREAMSQIDWLDFVIVETIFFDPMEENQLPEPLVCAPPNQSLLPYDAVYVSASFSHLHGVRIHGLESLLCLSFMEYDLLFC